MTHRAIRVVRWDDIAPALGSIDVVREIELGFAAYSRGECVIPPVGELALEDPPGEVHIKYGYVRGGDHYVVKIASGFYGNTELGLPTGNGMMLLFDRRTGQPAAILLDEGRLTDVRTAAAGAVAARYLAPERVERIGVLGTGVQARLQIEYLRGVVDCDRVLAWGRTPEHLERYCDDMTRKGFELEIAGEPRAVAEACELIVTTTTAREPLLAGAWIRPGTHVTAVGSDMPEKQELDAGALAGADLVVADSLAQCRVRGEIARALAAQAITEGDVVELGAIIDGRSPGRERADQITIADLTGVAVQDLQIASAVLRALA